MALTQRGINIPVTGQFQDGDDIVDALIAQGLSVDSAIGSAIAAAVNEANNYTDAALEQLDTGSALHIRTSSLTTIPAADTEGTLIGYRNSSPSAITVAGETLDSGDWAVWCWLGGAWVLLNKSGSSGGIIEPDETPPTPGTLTASNITDTSFTLTVTGASDDQALHPKPYRFSIDDGYSFSDWQSSPTYNVTGQTPGSEIICQHEVCDVAANTAKGAKITVNTLVSSHDIFDDFNRFGGSSNTWLAGDGGGAPAQQTLTGQTWLTDGLAWVRGATGTGYQSLPVRLGRLDIVGGRQVGLALTSNLVRVAFDYTANATANPRFLRVVVGSSLTDMIGVQIKQTATDITFSPVHNNTEVTAGVTPYVISASTATELPVEFIHDGTTLTVWVDGEERFDWTITAAVTGLYLGIGPVGSGAQTDYYIDNLAVDYL